VYFKDASQSLNTGYYLNTPKKKHVAVEFICTTEGEDYWTTLYWSGTSNHWYTAAEALIRRDSILIGWWKIEDPQHLQYTAPVDFPVEELKYTDPLEEVISGGLHHITMLQGPQSLTHTTTIGQRVFYSSPFIISSIAPTQLYSSSVDTPSSNDCLDSYLMGGTAPRGPGLVPSVRQRVCRKGSTPTQPAGLPPPCSRGLVTQCGVAPLDNPSIFNVLNIFCACWFINCKHLLSLILSATKGGDNNEMMWINLLP